MNKEFRVLEIGPGKGYFKDAIYELGLSDSYFAVDRNLAILQALGIDQDKQIHRSIQDLDFQDHQKFDLIYCAYVIEHLKDGLEVFAFAQKCRSLLKPGGELILLAPDALKTGMEFWNIDYTHVYPTTSRNVCMALKDAGFASLQVSPINGLLTVPGFQSFFVYWLIRLSVWGYSYRFFSRLCFFYREPLWSLDHFFYRLYCLLKQENLMFSAQSKRS